MPDMTIIIVSWNCREDLRVCLSSLAGALTRYAGETIVVDNASDDGTVDMVRKEFPSVRLIAHHANMGFAAANNAALRLSNAAYVLLLNPDTKAEPGALDSLLDFLERHPSAWAAGPTVLNADGSLQRTGVHFPSLWNLFVETVFLDRLFPMSRTFGAHRELFADPSEERRVDFVQGSVLLLRRNDVLARAGALDEGFFMYFEETDLCYRIARAGGETWICPSSRVVHYGGGREGHYDERRLVYYHRSLFRFFAKHRGSMARLLARAIMAVRVPIRVLAWGLIALTRPAMREGAWSSVRGYCRTFVLVFSEPLGLP